jgi:hypothetical protein
MLFLRRIMHRYVDQRLLDLIAINNLAYFFFNHAAVPIPPTYTAYKLFEEKDGMPRSLVHGMPTEDGRRSRMFPLDEWIDSEPGKPGFNCFEDPIALLKYYPRFRVRAPKLVACRIQVSVPNVPRLGDNYQKYYKMIIYPDDWYNRVKPHELGISDFDDQFNIWVDEYERQHVRT